MGRYMLWPLMGSVRNTDGVARYGGGGDVGVVDDMNGGVGRREFEVG
jgi:hypothetical protein